VAPLQSPSTALGPFLWTPAFADVEPPHSRMMILRTMPSVPWPSQYWRTIVFTVLTRTRMGSAHRKDNGNQAPKILGFDIFHIWRPTISASLLATAGAERARPGNRRAIQQQSIRHHQAGHAAIGQAGWATATGQRERVSTIQYRPLTCVGRASRLIDLRAQTQGSLICHYGFRCRSETTVFSYAQLRPIGSTDAS
jgi:hypothetical protein